jgi:phage-related protein
MRNLGFILLVFFLSASLLIGCGSEEKSKSEKSKKKTSLEDVKKETKEALDATAAYTREQQEEYRKKIEAKLKEIDKEIDELKIKAGKLKEDAKVKVDQSVDDLQTKKNEVYVKLDKLKTNRGQAWEDLKSGIDAAMKELGISYEKARSRFDNPSKPEQK